MSTTPTSEQTPAATKPRGRNLRWLWIVALIAVIAIAGIVLWFVFSGSDGEPTLAFDGTSLTYSGPESLTVGAVTFTLENTSDGPATFAWGLINDDSITLEDEVAWVEANPGAVPPWIQTWGEIGRVEAGTVVKPTAMLLEGRNDLVAWPPGGNTSVAIIIDVTGD
jgi:hypothetical protein